jgi:trk system potassium uptake protein TrkH
MQAVLVLLCILVAWYFSEPLYPFLIASLLAFIIGLLLNAISGRHTHSASISRREAYLIVALSWLLMASTGCLPYLISNSIPEFVNAWFESVSGYTTTGSSVLSDVESLPKSILFFRSYTHWIGGIGIIVLVILVMPAFKIGGNSLFFLESSLQEKIKPKISSVGKRLLLIYLFLTVSEVILLYVGKMDLYESICHAFGTVATGGFSPRNTSIVEYSPYIQYVIMVFMLLAGTNFVVYYYLIKGEFNWIKNNEELRFCLLIIISIGFLLTAALYFNLDKTLEEAFRESFFQLISIVSCTGFASADYLHWPFFAVVILFFAMFLGGSTGSTAGGIKIARHLLLLKNCRRIIRQMIYANAVISVKINENRISTEANNHLMTFLTVYIFFFLIGTLVLVLLGIDSKTASSSVATSLAGIGPGMGTVGPASNFAHLPGVVKIILTFLMLVGRLEIFTMLIFISPSFWKK